MGEIYRQNVGIYYFKNVYKNQILNRIYKIISCLLFKDSLK